MKNSKTISVLLATLCVMSASNIAFADTGVVNTPALRIRESASKDSEVITRAYEDDEVEILGEEGDWYKVKVDGKTGYASKPLITKKETSSNKNEVAKNEVSNEKNETPAQTSNNTKQEENNEVDPSKTTIKDDVVARIMPNFASNEYALLTKGTEVEVVRNLNNWSEIVVDGRKVWVLKSRISVGEEPVDETPQETNNTDEEQNTVADNTADANTNTTSNENTTANNNTVKMKQHLKIETLKVL